MKIQYFSDIHLEFGPTILSATDADVVIAAGDIGVGADGVEWLKTSGKPTIYIAGNHEYYGGEMGTVQASIREAVAGSNIRFLECEATELHGVRFLGATLWTDFLGGNTRLMDALKDQMNDYHQVRLGANLLKPSDLVALNREARAWLQNELATTYPGPTVVVTHHAPLFSSWHAPENSLFKGAYCNDLSQFVIDYDIALWVHGHVHARSDYRANALRVVCNPRGYDGYQLVDGFSDSRIVTLG